MRSSNLSLLIFQFVFVVVVFIIILFFQTSVPDGSVSGDCGIVRIRNSFFWKATETQPFPQVSRIVEQAYKNTFSPLLASCAKRETLQVCIDRFYNRHILNITAKDEGEDKNVESDEKGLSLAEAQHWWFRTMLRDSLDELDNHNRMRVAYTEDPNVSICLIEKVAIKHWVNIFKTLNGNGQMRPDMGNDMNLPASEEGYPSILFLRDPLVRFLSAYLDKCVDTPHRIKENFCQPNAIYNNTPTTQQLLKGFLFGDEKRVGRRAMFAAYVDTMPLKWNRHFYPQSLFCNGVYRYLDSYDFVGHMNSTFYHTLEAVNERYGDRFAKEVNRIFGLNKMSNVTATVSTGVETKASEKMLEYYSPRSLVRVLEYVSVDYMLLGLPFPEWAEEMLATTA